MVAAQRAGELHDGDPSRISALICSTVHGLAKLERLGESKAVSVLKDVDALSLLLIDLIAKRAGEMAETRQNGVSRNDCRSRQRILLVGRIDLSQPIGSTASQAASAKAGCERCAANPMSSAPPAASSWRDSSSVWRSRAGEATMTTKSAISAAARAGAALQSEA